MVYINRSLVPLTHSNPPATVPALPRLSVEIYILERLKQGFWTMMEVGITPQTKGLNDHVQNKCNAETSPHHCRHPALSLTGSPQLWQAGLWSLHWELGQPRRKVLKIQTLPFLKMSTEEIEVDKFQLHALSKTFQWVLKYSISVMSRQPRIIICPKKAQRPNKWGRGKQLVG